MKLTRKLGGLFDGLKILGKKEGEVYSQIDKLCDTGSYSEGGDGVHDCTVAGLGRLAI